MNKHVALRRVAEHELSEGAAEIQQVLSLVSQHERWRAECLNLIASENAYSRTVLTTLSSDLAQRYANYLGRDRAHRTYRGTRFVEQIEDQADRLARKVFDAKHVELRAISGQVAGAAVVAGLCSPGDAVLELPRNAGGHQVAGRMAQVPLFNLDVHDLAFDAESYNVDLGAAVQQIRGLRPRAVILGSSYYLFPHPVRELALEVHKYGGVVAYDASHVLGLMAGGLFQQPLAEGADVVFGSTHKTLPGPQGGIIYANDEGLLGRVSAGVYPALVTNHHVARMPAMVVALAEMEEWGAQYGSVVIRNARALGKELTQRQIRVVGSAHGFTDSHTLLVLPPPDRTAHDWSVALERANIITTSVPVPEELGEGAIRIGTQEITRRGATSVDMPQVADVVARVLHAEDPEVVAADVRSLAARFTGMEYSADRLGLAVEAADASSEFGTGMVSP